MTDEKKIRQLLEAFYNGDTTVEEETLLLNFFNDKNLNEQWRTEKDLFNILYNSSDISLPKGFSERLASTVDKHIEVSSQEADIKVIDNNFEKSSQQTNRRSISSGRRFLVSIGSAAAIALLCIGLFFVTNKPVPTKAMVDTYANPEEAAAVAEQTLMLVSSKLNKGLSSLEKTKESIDKTNELLSKILIIK